MGSSRISVWDIRYCRSVIRSYARTAGCGVITYVVPFTKPFPFYSSADSDSARSPQQISRKIIPSFDSLLITSDPTKQSSLTTTLQTSITSLVNASHITGPFFLGSTISFVDVMFAPWIIRLSRVLKFYRAWPDPEVGTRWESWVQAVEEDERVRGTVSEERAYQQAYENAASKGCADAHGVEVC